MVIFCVVCDSGRPDGVPAIERCYVDSDVYVQKEKGLIWH